MELLNYVEYQDIVLDLKIDHNIYYLCQHIVPLLKAWIFFGRHSKETRWKSPRILTVFLWSFLRKDWCSVFAYALCKQQGTGHDNLSRAHSNCLRTNDG